jgi:hypothetical protein
MAKLSPKVTVEQKFGGRKKLIDDLLPLLEVTDTADTRKRLQGTSNQKLIRLHEVATEVRKRFHSKKALVEQIAQKKFAPGKPDSAYVTKISGYTVKRLLDLYRQVG